MAIECPISPLLLLLNIARLQGFFQEVFIPTLCYRIAKRRSVPYMSTRCHSEWHLHYSGYGCAGYLVYLFVGPCPGTKGREAGITSSPSLIWSDNQPPAETVYGFCLKSNLRDATMLEKGGAVMFDEPPPYHNSVHIPQRADIVERISRDTNEVC